MISIGRALVATTLLSFARPIAAQESTALNQGDRFIGGWAGASFYAPAGEHLGQTSNRHFYLLALRSEWVLETAKQFALSATIDLIPAAVVTNNPTYRQERSASRDAPGTSKLETGSSAVYGAGITPFGLKLSSPLVRRTNIYLTGAVGGLWFTRDTPVPDSRRFNFTFEYGGGFQFLRSSRKAIVVGYKFHHLSNAYTAPRNPGLDGNVFYLGVLTRR
jgi:hypothetical protein